MTPSRRERGPFVLVLALALSFSAAGCPCVRGAVNASPELRFWLFSSYGAPRVCPELTKRGVPLKLPSFGPASVGRFFPEQCDAQVDEGRKTVVVRVSGTGYATLPVARRVGFSCAVTVEYRPDFRLEEDATYVWGTFSRLVAPPELRILGVENPVVNLASQTPVGTVAVGLAQGLVSGELGKGFTVVHTETGDDFTIGHIEPPERPRRLVATTPGRSSVVADVTEIQPRAREYVGPFELDGSGNPVFLRARVEGAPVTYTLVDRPSGDAWRRAYEAAQPLAPGFVTPYAQGELRGDTQVPLPSRQGQFFLVLENPQATFLGGLGVGLGETPSRVTYAVETAGR
jgi:hypothetical protein